MTDAIDPATQPARRQSAFGWKAYLLFSLIPIGMLAGASCAALYEPADPQAVSRVVMTGLPMTLGVFVAITFLSIIPAALIAGLIALVRGKGFRKWMFFIHAGLSLVMTAVVGLSLVLAGPGGHTPKKNPWYDNIRLSC